MKKLWIVMGLLILALLLFGCAEEEVPPHEHIEGEWETLNAATCTANGLQVSECTFCGKRMEEEIPATGHVAGEWEIITASSCEHEGLKQKKCYVCNKEIDQEVIPMHNTKNQDAVAATCTATGLTKGSYCADCGLIFEEQTVIPMIAHPFETISEVPATCQKAGRTKGIVCGGCGLVQIESVEIPKKPHQPVTDEAIEPSCLRGGSTEGSHCAGCDLVYVPVEKLAPLGHNLHATTGECLRCNDSDYEKYTGWEAFQNYYADDQNFILDLRSISFEPDEEYRIAIKATHQSVRIIGNPSKVYSNLLFTVESRNDKLSMDFVNVQIESQKTIISSDSACNMTIGMYGEACALSCLKANDGDLNVIMQTTTPGKNGNPALKLSGNLTLFCAADSVRINGGDGGIGGSGVSSVSKGGNGAYAIQAKGIHVNFAQGCSKANLLIVGGKGGRGGWNIFAEADGGSDAPNANVTIVYN